MIFSPAFFIIQDEFWCEWMKRKQDLPCAIVRSPQSPPVVSRTYKYIVQKVKEHCIHIAWSVEGSTKVLSANTSAKLIYAQRRLHLY